MSKYTTEVRFICEYEAGMTKSTGYLGVNELLEIAYPKVFNFSFPIYDEAYRPVLCKKILKHYYTREIGEETVGLWKLRLDTRLNEIMPYYNKLYESALLEFNPMYDTDLHKEYNKVGETSKEGTTSGTDANTGSKNAQIITDRDLTERVTTDSLDTFNDTHTNHNVTDQDGTYQDTDTNWNVYSDTPQGALTRVNEETYLTDARKITDNKSGNSTNDVVIDGTDAHTGTVRNDGHNNSTGTEDVTVTETESHSDTTNRTGAYDETLNTTDDYVEHVFGKSSGTSFSKMLQEYRETLLNIDVMIINELSDLFMNIW